MFNKLTPSKRISEIDGLRGACILLVYIGHLIAWRYADGMAIFVVQIGIFMSHLGVMIFFGISGLVITNLFLIETKTAEFSAWRFYLRRAIRILPPLCFYLFVIALLRYEGLINQSQTGIAKSILFSCNIYDDCGWFAGHTWSLGFEWQFYCLFPVLVLLRKALPSTLLIGSFGILVLTAYGILPSDVKSIAFLGLGCVIAYNKNELRPILELRALLPIKQLLCSSFFQFFGAISYSLYLWQQLFTGSPSDYLAGSPLDVPLLALPSAYLSYIFLEKKSGAYLRKLCTSNRHAA